MNTNQNLGAQTVAQGNAENSQFLTFTVGNEEYGVDIIKVTEIRGWQETTVMPDSPSYMKGVVDLRGVVVPIFDLKNRFGKGDIEIDNSKVVIVLNLAGKVIGVLVDGVSDIVSVNTAEIKESPQTTESQVDNAYINGLISQDEKMIILLDIENLFGIEIINKVTTNQN